MGKFKSPRQAQRFLGTHDQLSTIFRPRRYRLTAISYRHARTDAKDLWNTYALEMTVGSTANCHVQSVGNSLAMPFLIVG